MIGFTPYCVLRVPVGDQSCAMRRQGGLVAIEVYFDENYQMIRVFLCIDDLSLFDVHVG